MKLYGGFFGTLSAAVRVLLVCKFVSAKCCACSCTGQLEGSRGVSQQHLKGCSNVLNLVAGPILAMLTTTTLILSFPPLTSQKRRGRAGKEKAGNIIVRL